MTARTYVCYSKAYVDVWNPQFIGDNQPEIPLSLGGGEIPVDVIQPLNAITGLRADIWSMDNSEYWGDQNSRGIKVTHARWSPTNRTIYFRWQGNWQVHERVAEFYMDLSVVVSFAVGALEVETRKFEPPKS